MKKIGIEQNKQPNSKLLTDSLTGIQRDILLTRK